MTGDRYGTAAVTHIILRKQAVLSVGYKAAPRPELTTMTSLSPRDTLTACHACVGKLARAAYGRMRSRRHVSQLTLITEIGFATRGRRAVFTGYTPWGGRSLAQSYRA